MHPFRRLFRYYFPPASVWASRPAYFLSGLWVGRLLRALPVLMGVGVTCVMGWWGSTSQELSATPMAFLAPLVGLATGVLTRILVVSADTTAEWMHLRWGRAGWNELGADVWAGGLDLLQRSAQARAQAQRWLERDPEGLLRARHLLKLKARTWVDIRPWGAGEAMGAIDGSLAVREMERMEKARRASVRMSERLPQASRSGPPRARF